MATLGWSFGGCGLSGQRPVLLAPGYSFHYTLAMIINTFVV